jgi:pimeloyl-ACP methyl ester carboxylesterase
MATDFKGIGGEVTVDGHRLETLTYPAPDRSRPIIVMLHEGLGSVSLWRDFPARLAAATQCGVMAYSRYGHGASDVLREPRSDDFMYHEATVVLPALLEALHIELPVLLGHSDGGSIALIYAALASSQRRAAQPRALILEAPHVFVEDITVESIAKVRDAYASTDLRTKLGRHHDHVDEMFQEWTKIWLDGKFRDWNIEGELHKVRCPVLVIQGTDDEYGTMAQVAAIRRGVKDAETLLPPECGHSPHRDQTEAMLGAITGFLSERLKI